MAAHGFEQALRDRPDDVDLKSGLADALPWLTAERPYESRIEIYRRIVTLREDVFKTRPADRRSKQELALACSRLYTQLGGVGPGEALSAFERSTALRLELAEEFPDDPDAIDGVFTSFLKLARATSSTQSLALYRRALGFGRESLRLQPNDTLTAHNFVLAAKGTAAGYWDLGRKEQAIAELRQSVKVLDGMARANPDTPRIQELYLEICENLVDRLADQKRLGEAARALLESRMALDRLSRNTAADIAAVAGRRLEIARRLGEIQPELTAEQNLQRDELLDGAVRDYREAMLEGWNDVAFLRAATPLKDRPEYADLLREAGSAASQPKKLTASGKAMVASRAIRPVLVVSRPKVDIKLDRARTQAALSVARSRSGLADEALASMEKARSFFNELARKTRRLRGQERPRRGAPRLLRGSL